MNGRWIEVARIAFGGRRFHDHALDLGALSELAQFQRIVAETAKALWQKTNLDRERLPRRFEERTRLCLRAIEDGSAVAPLEVYVEEPEQSQLFAAGGSEVSQAVALAQRTFRAAELDEPLPPDLPKELLPELEKFGSGLAQDETIEIAVPKHKSARINHATRRRLARFIEPRHETRLDVVGEVLEADVRRGRFQIWPDERTCINVAFSPDQEAQVTTALQDHRSLRVRVVGVAESTPDGMMVNVSKVERLALEPVGEASYDSRARPIEDVLAELARDVPEKEWRELPPDLSENLDHYLYGTPGQ